MRALQLPPVFILLAALLFTVNCNESLVVKNVDYSQQLESVLTPDQDGVVDDVRHGIRYSILPFQYEEFQDSSEVMITSVRMIRNTEGYYFITADGFKHVYVMAPKKGEMKLERKIMVSESGLKSPAFNWREPIVQLLDEYDNTVYLLNEKGIYQKEEAS